MHRTGLRSLLMAVAVAAALPCPAPAQITADALEGAWSAERYHLADGPVHEVRGHIFFGGRDWQVLFFVLDDEGRPRRGSGEGGSYELVDGQVVFTHLFNLSVGDAMPGLAATDLRMVVRDPEGAPTEPTDLRIAGDVLTLGFPSGNRMTFRRR
ncbi:MAG: hypothetical protein RJQ04_06375 [Longimicrobiales bacterium]